MTLAGSDRLLSDLMLAKQEGQKHQHASIMDDPPHVYVAFSEAFPVRRVTGDVLGNQQRHTGNRGLSNHLCRRSEENPLFKAELSRCSFIICLLCLLFGIWLLSIKIT